MSLNIFGYHKLKDGDQFPVTPENNVQAVWHTEVHKKWGAVFLKTLISIAKKDHNSQVL